MNEEDISHRCLDNPILYPDVQDIELHRPATVPGNLRQLEKIVRRKALSLYQRVLDCYCS